MTEEITGEKNLRWLILGTFLFYSLNVTGFRIKKFVLVESCLKTEPVDMVFWVPYCVGVVAFWIWPNVGQWVLLGFFILAVVTLFLTTGRFVIWPNERKTQSYNKYFKDTHHIIKPSDIRLVPDTFHLALLVLVPLNLVGVILWIVFR